MIKNTTSFACTLAITALLFCCHACTTTGGETVVAIEGDQWLINGEPVLKGSPAEGLLVNVRMVNAVFEDIGPEAAASLPEDFDPEKNTDEFISQIPAYYAQGVRAFTIGLQGGMPGYEGAVNSAFNADGTLRQPYLDRVARVIRAADEQGMVIILSCFYQRQHSHDHALQGKPAIFNAVTNVTQWITDQKFTNVMLEISNEFAHGGFSRWKDGDWLKSVEAQVELIKHAKKTAPNLLVSTSGMGSGKVSAPIGEASDFILMHFNRTPISLIPERIMEARSYGKPVVCNEDDKIGKLGAEAARLSIKSGAGWGFMQMQKNQGVPFVFEGPEDDTEVYNMLARLTTPGASVEDIPGKPFSVLVTHPVDGDVFHSGEPVTMRAVVTGVDDSERIEVQFFAEEELLGKSSAPPWEFTWNNPPEGKYDVMAVVKDAHRVEVMRSGTADFEVRSR